MTTLIIGGGWSGLAAAVSLCRQGQSVTVIEAAAQLGGRARDVQWQDLTLDNGQHLMIGAYHTLLEMLAIIGVSQDKVFHQIDFDVSIIAKQYPTLRLSNGKLLPWPLGLANRLIRQKGGLSLLRDITRIYRHIRPCLEQPDMTVAAWLAVTRQQIRTIEQFWEPLCLATLNTPVNEASAHVFATVIKDMFQSKQSAQPLIPKISLGKLFPKQAANFITHHGGEIRLQQRIIKLYTEQDKVVAAETRQGEIIHADTFILATSPSAAKHLMPVTTAFNVSDQPITTVYLQYSQAIFLSQMMTGLSGTTAQWVFDRQHDREGLIAVVISGPGTHEKWSHQQLIAVVCKELSNLLAINASLIDGKVIREKRATFSCHSGVQSLRPGNQTSLKNLFLAGDYTQCRYPATLETAIHSGVQAAIVVRQEHN